MERGIYLRGELPSTPECPCEWSGQGVTVNPCLRGWVIGCFSDEVLSKTVQI